MIVEEIEALLEKLEQRVAALEYGSESEWADRYDRENYCCCCCEDK